MKVISSSRKAGRMWARALRSIDTGLVFRWGTDAPTEREGMTIPSAISVSHTKNKVQMAKILYASLGDRFPMIKLEELSDAICPIIKKKYNHSKGRGVGMITNSNQLDATGEYYYMRYIPTKVEYRVITDARGKHFVIFRKNRTTDGESDFRMNHSLGNCTFYRIKPENAPRIVKDLAVKAVGSLGLLIGGVDIGIHFENKRAYVFEVNSAPNMSRTKRCKEFYEVIKEIVEEAGQ